MKITKSQLKQIIKEELSRILNENEGMTKEDEDFLIDNDFDDPPMGLTDAQEKAYVDALRKGENPDEVYERFEDVAEQNEYDAYQDEYGRGY